MKKLIPLLIISLLIAGCSNTKITNSEAKVKELEQKIIDLQFQQASTTAVISPTSTPTTTAETITPEPTKKNSEIILAPKPIVTANQATICLKETILYNDQCISYDSWCKNSYGSNSYYTGEIKDNKFICGCSAGYAWNEQRTGCVDPLAYKAIKATVCPESSYRSENFTDICYCAPGYILNSDKNGCINPSSAKIQQPAKTNDQICQDSYGLNSYWSGITNSNGNLICYCKSGYVWNEQKTSCIITPADDSVIKIAKCEAEKTQLAQTFQRLETTAGQMTYTNVLKELDSTDPCGNLFLPDAIYTCMDGHASLAKSEADRIYNEQHSQNLITIQNSYIECLNR